MVIHMVMLVLELNKLLSNTHHKYYMLGKYYIN